MKIKITRGIAGSGKSTWVAKNYPGAVVFSTDRHHIDADGVYRFKLDRLAEFHNRTLKEFAEFVLNPHAPVCVVDNTNIKMFEIAPYYRLAEACGHDVEIIWVNCHPGVAHLRQEHGVPYNKLLEMAQSFEALPPWWNVTHVYNS